MAKKSSKKTAKPVRPQLGEGVEILNAGSVLEDPITRTLETNYMPYAMSVIVSRALPEIDGFKPAHRKLLYTMYEMGLIKGARTKSANIVGSTMHLNPHGDAAIYDTMVRMGRGNESLLVPFVDSKGNFGKAYSRDMSCAAARYTEAKLESVCEELFRDIDKETVDFVPNYDGTTTEPTLLPVTFPTILANNTLGIAVGMACNICSFNLAELCSTTVALMKDAKHDISTTMPAPDFVGGGQILYDEAQMRDIFENGRGSVKVRARYAAVPGENMIEITTKPLVPLWTADTAHHHGGGHHGRAHPAAGDFPDHSGQQRSPSWSRRARSKKSAICATRRFERRCLTSRTGSRQARACVDVVPGENMTS